MDAAAFLGETGKGNKTRVVGRIRPDKNSKALEMLILSVWEIDWEDVGIAEGILCSLRFKHAAVNIVI